ncbi:IclR family transcriptional regulator [Sinisalibacter aestuarii]|uniref:Transcriptional regulator n=1 Tax=Sinisalibacter aestuarii TaxID=2949426 RepID=A0ABQ5LYD7_9RHOB|nr:IclR family transcriptional regulator [Sinisalibacter aestuarii]GKY89967.1 transcriptional regulator [Sinisalibacter aestuarii]
MDDNSAKQDGTQAIRRAATLLKQVAQNGGTGVKLRDLTETTGLSRSTAHRILKALLDEHLLEYNDTSKRYTIGPLAFELSLASGLREREIMQWAPVIDEFRNQTGATTYLMGRSGSESVCLHKAEGTSVLRAIPVQPGQRRLLGVGAGATALLAQCSDEVIESTLQALRPYLDEYPNLSPEQIRRNVARVRETGFSESRGSVVDGVYGLAMALPGTGESATLAISVAVHQSFATEEKIATWKRLMTSLRKTAEKMRAARI